MNTKSALSETLIDIVGTHAVGEINYNLSLIDWYQTHGSLYDMQVEILRSVNMGVWIFDVKDLPHDNFELETGAYGQGQLIRVMAVDLTPEMFRELAWQQWIGFAMGTLVVMKLSWNVMEIFTHPGQFADLVQRFGFSAGIVSYFDSESWLVYQATQI